MDLHLNQPACDAQLWPLDPNVVFLNHGSFGSCPRSVLQFQREIQNRLERQPVQFFVRDLEPMLDQARSDLAQFLGADAEDLVFVPNATAGVNTVLRSLSFERGDELLVTDHEYNACRNALNFVAGRTGARVVMAPVPFPSQGADEIVGSVLQQATDRTRLALLDHVSSQTGLVFPLERLVSELAARGIDALVDGAHAPGMIPVQLRQLRATYYTGNCHKWLCAPKGAGFLFVRRDRQKLIRPLAISHGANSVRTDRSKFLIEFGWTGTWDPSAFLSVPEALRFMGALAPGGWVEIMRRNRELALAARRILCQSLNINWPCPDDLVGALASVPIPEATGPQPPPSPLYSDAVQDRLRAEHQIEVPVIPWPAPPKRLLRVSAQLYNSLPHYERLAQALERIFS
ncbi:MAG: aminotransferase class V-fold PLP-dependent enzyme [Verrucomicrobia bacterium]|nr:aminotransferase class V-fold PLP-dependent enzyme [Verrucomicrobiota bacterium]